MRTWERSFIGLSVGIWVREMETGFAGNTYLTVWENVCPTLESQEKRGFGAARGQRCTGYIVSPVPNALVERVQPAALDGGFQLIGVADD